MHELDDTEKDMNDMLKYLSEVEELVRSGQDLREIQSMMDVTKDTMKEHFESYNKFKGQIEEIQSEADMALSKLNFYDTAPGDISSI